MKECGMPSFFQSTTASQHYEVPVNSILTPSWGWNRINKHLKRGCIEMDNREAMGKSRRTEKEPSILPQLL
ncbi:hypothetical protein K443DRAFT_678949 [Laccaria amethystina LaAM-08-1]|uniref:Uncharacterized protein n=1 Tax=Laccaria amethystina LaAM-08-1 TaxID=1095629 RepID=A0A0C9XGN1_9AGAR|nr:hypothetical protein K443DRAFT_678949 [Laccaria amethystina LaAM-08-1]